MAILHTNPSVSYACPFQDHPEETPERQTPYIVELPDEPDVAQDVIFQDEQQSKKLVRTLALLSIATKQDFSKS